MCWLHQEERHACATVGGFPNGAMAQEGTRWAWMLIHLSSITFLVSNVMSTIACVELARCSPRDPGMTPRGLRVHQLVYPV